MAVLLGRTSSATTADSNASGSPTGHPFVASATGILATIYCQPKNTNGTLTEFELGIYADSAGTPGALLGRVNVTAGFTGAGPFSADGFSVSIASGTTYYLATLTVGAGFSWQGDPSGGNYRERSVGGLTDLPNPMGTVLAAQGTGLAIWGEDAVACMHVSRSMTPKG